MKLVSVLYVALTAGCGTAASSRGSLSYSIAMGIRNGGGVGAGVTKGFGGPVALDKQSGTTSSGSGGGGNGGGTNEIGEVSARQAGMGRGSGGCASRATLGGEATLAGGTMHPETATSPVAQGGMKGEAYVPHRLVVSMNSGGAPTLGMSHRAGDADADPMDEIGTSGPAVLQGMSDESSMVRTLGGKGGGYVSDSQRVATSRRRGLQGLAVGALSGLDLIDTATGTKVALLYNGQEIPVDAETSKLYTVNATFVGNVQSVRFEHQTSPSLKFAVTVENGAPFVMCGNRGSVYVPCRSLGSLGMHTIVATPYSARNEGGVRGKSFMVSFTMVAIGISRLELMYTGSTAAPARMVQTLAFDSINVVDLKTLNLPMTAFSIQAVRTGTTVQSVQFSNGQRKTGLPWAYCGNEGQMYKTCNNLVVGANVSISVTPFPLQFQQGVPFPARSTTVRIIDSRAGTKRPAVSPSLSPPTTPTAMSQCTIPKASECSESLFFLQEVRGISNASLLRSHLICYSS
jgi:hypothetical protein